MAGRTYGGVSLEERRARRRRRLLDAGLEQIGTRGYDACTVKSVCAEARLTERYFYEHFTDRLDLLCAVYEDVVAGVLGATVAAIEDAPPTVVDRARAGLRAFVGALGDDPRRARVQLVDSIGRSARLDARRREVMHGYADLIAADAARLAPRPDATDLERRVAAMGLVGATNELVIDWTAGALPVGRDELVEHLVRLFVAAAEAPAPGRPGAADEAAEGAPTRPA